MFLIKLVLVHLRTSRCLTLCWCTSRCLTLLSLIYLFLSEFGYLRECGISSCNCEISNRSPNMKHPDRNKHLSLISSSPQIVALSICDPTTTNNLNTSKYKYIWDKQKKKHGNKPVLLEYIYIYRTIYTNGSHFFYC